MKQVFKKVWYRESPMKKSTFDEAFKRDTGTLEIDDSVLSYQGSEFNFEVTKIEKIEYRRIGADMNSSMIVTGHLDNQIRKFYFTDARAFGYSTVLGGTERMYNKIKMHLNSEEVVSKYISDFKKRVYFIVFLIASLIYGYIKIFIL